MSIQVTCKECSSTMRAPDSAAGKTARCPKCGSGVEIPEPIFEAELADESNGQNADAFDSVQSLDQAFDTSSEKRVPCQKCGEMILINAGKCRYCKEIFDPELKKLTPKSKSPGGIDENLSVGDWIVALICPGIGFIGGLVWMIQGKPKGLKTIGVSLIAMLFYAALRAAAESARQNQF